MPAAEAQILANRANARKSSGPRTAEGKEHSRANALKHGLTGAGVALVEADAAEVERMNAAMQAELRPASETGRLLVRRVATMAVRLDRCVAQEDAAIAENVRRAVEEFEAPEGMDDDQAERLREQAGRRALFDPSKGACLARKYEAAAERAMYKALKEFREVEGRGRAPALVAQVGQLGPFSPAPAPATPAPATPAPAAHSLRNPADDPGSWPLLWTTYPLAGGISEVPMTIGRR